MLTFVRSFIAVAAVLALMLPRPVSAQLDEDECTRAALVERARRLHALR